MQLSDLVVAIHLGRNNGKIPFCNLLRRTSHIFKRSRNRSGDLVEQSADENEGDNEPNNHSPLEVVHIGENLVLWNEENERPSRVANRMNGVVILNTCICVCKENRLF